MDERREEMIAAMLAEYKKELNSLTDQELWKHYKTVRKAQNMNSAELQRFMRSVSDHLS